MYKRTESNNFGDSVKKCEMLLNIIFLVQVIQHSKYIVPPWTLSLRINIFA